MCELQVVLTPAPVCSQYEQADDLCVITCYFNWYHFRSRAQNLNVFANSLHRSKIPLVIIECANVRGQFELAEGPNVIHVSSRSMAWMKERLLNIALQKVPPQYSKIAWIDADVLFESASWARDASTLLNQCVVVQLFKTAARLPPNGLLRTSPRDHYRSFASIYQLNPNALRNGIYKRHGHPGFAWAARRGFLNAHGLYDVCVGGAADHVMAHAFCGDWESPCIRRTFGTGAMLEHFTSWCKRMYGDVQAQVGVVPGRLLHLWHGSLENRQYGVRTKELVEMGFNPFEDLVLNDFGCWEWSANREDLRRWSERYFFNRREDELSAEGPLHVLEISVDDERQLGKSIRLLLRQPEFDGYYHIVAKHSGKCLEVDGGSVDSKARVVQRAMNGCDYQQWVLVRRPNGCYHIFSKHSGKCLDVQGYKKGNCAGVCQYAFHGGDNQKWELRDAEDGYFHIIAKHSGKALDVANYSRDDGANVFQYTLHGEDNQQWKFAPVKHTMQ